ncbi:unnamed protein product [Phaedon cochleariae]|uniref:Multidrug resistance-associated protein lethal(2)03659 n=1 Tax=Phaedon cochleariae TaxID=80249 RepID=A0A9P0DNR7_PHACE|nr:unnamed protein product [Phaedon cochleariae]
MDSNKKHINPSPESKSGAFSKLFFCWVLPFFKYGYKRDLETTDIYNATKNDLSAPLGDELEKYWKRELERSAIKKRKPSLKRAIFFTFWKSYIPFGIYLFFQVVILRNLQPVVLSEYIDYFEYSQDQYHLGNWELTRSQYGWLIAVCVIILPFFNMIIVHHCQIGCQRVGMRIRIACCSLVYRKILRLSQLSLGETAAGQVVNLMSNDVQRFDLASVDFHYLWIMPILFVTSFYLMIDRVGLAAVAGMIAMTIEALPFQGYLSRIQGKLRGKIAQKTDFRVKLMSEIVSGIQVIKMYAWEKPFDKMVELSRKLEIKYITKAAYIKGLSIALVVYTERLTLYLTLIAYVFLGHRLTSDIVFCMAQYFNIVQLYMCFYFPNGLATYAEARVTIKRLEEFLLLEENTELIANSDLIIDDEKRGTIKIEEVSASWVLNSTSNTLNDINLNIGAGKLCCVVGNVGSGKSSMLQLLLRELPLKSGHLEVNGHVSFASQEPWLFVSSVKENILFGQPYLKNRYADVVNVCALERDFKQFVHGDKTLVGERGVSLSGGQRARINLARAVYVDADIYLFDDPLSAVDTHVGKHLFEKCIRDYLKGKTRILVTHQIQFLKQAEIIVVMNNGRIENIGTFETLADDLLKTIKRQDSEDDAKKEMIVKEKPMIKHERMLSIVSVASSIGKEFTEVEQTIQEEVEKGQLSFSMYLEYYRTGASICLLTFMIVLFIIAQMFSNGCDLWVAHWTNVETAHAANETRQKNTLSNAETSERNNIEDSDNFIESQKSYIYIYTIFIVGSIILTTARSLLFYRVCTKASEGLHNKMFSNVLKAPMRFFNTNPSGRILNRFSRDIGAVDEILPKATMDAITAFLVMLGILMMVFIVTPWMILPAVVLGIFFHFFRSVYLSSAQDIKRIEGVNRAPVFSHISATLYGISTIRSSKAEEMVIHEFDSLQDQHTGSWFMFLACSGALGFYLDCISLAFLILVTFQFLIIDTNSGMSGNIGLVVSSSMILIGMLQLGVRQTTEVSSNMTSVERVMQYTKVEKEEELNPGASEKPENWPSAGKISFRNTYLRYNPDDPPALKNLNIVIQPGEKIGIVGRTGAGKSTLISSLFRLAPIDGTMAIDDIDTSTVSLEHLRSNISIIPQEPILFSASIRYNLDPFSKVSDDVIWQALANVELKDTIENLDQKVCEGGSNFSAGQRQLVCLARAIIRNNKVLVMDEATANVDPHTDALIQNTIRENFKDCTVLTIAHRLNTIMDSDKVLVMDSGKAVEFESPHRLLQLPGGYFTKMVEKTGPVMEAQLRQIAKIAYKLED